MISKVLSSVIRKFLDPSFRKFLALSVGQLAVNWCITVFLHEVVHLSESRAYGISLTIVFVLNFLMLRYWVYRDTASQRNMAVQLTHVALTSIAFRFIDWTLLTLIVTYIGLDYRLTIFVVAGISFISRFLIYHTIFTAKPKGAGEPNLQE